MMKTTIFNRLLAAALPPPLLVLALTALYLNFLADDPGVAALPQSLWFIIPAGLALLVLSIFLAARSIARPILRMTTSFHRAAAKKPDSHTDQEEQQIAASGIVELERLQAAWREMLDQLAVARAQTATLDSARPGAGGQPPQRAEEKRPGLLEKLGGLNGLDIRYGLNAVAGQTDVYERALRLLHAKIPGMTAMLGELLAWEEMKDFRTHAHGMKSALASVGAIALSDAAYALEKAAAAGNAEHCRAALPDFLDRLRELDRHFAALFDEETECAAPRPAGDARSLAQGAASLCMALAGHDYDAIQETLRTLLERDYGSAAEETMARAKAQIDLFEYDAARKLLRKFFTESGD